MSSVTFEVLRWHIASYLRVADVTCILANVSDRVLDGIFDCVHYKQPHGLKTDVISTCGDECDDGEIIEDVSNHLFDILKTHNFANIIMQRYRNGRLHHDTEPAVVRDSGYRAWYSNGKLHRCDLPAIQVTGDNNLHVWMQHDKIHHENGPTVTYLQLGTYCLHYWLNDICVGREDIIEP